MLDMESGRQGETYLRRAEPQSISYFAVKTILFLCTISQQNTYILYTQPKIKHKFFKE